MYLKAVLNTLSQNKKSNTLLKHSESEYFCVNYPSGTGCFREQICAVGKLPARACSSEVAGPGKGSFVPPVDAHAAGSLWGPGSSPGPGDLATVSELCIQGSLETWSITGVYNF
jgi:hypothetical protein